jgi:hypothetical protein
MRSEQFAALLAEVAAISDQRTSNVFRWVAELNDMSMSTLRAIKASRVLMAETDVILAKR